MLDYPMSRWKFAILKKKRCQMIKPILKSGVLNTVETEVSLLNLSDTLKMNKHVVFVCWILWPNTKHSNYDPILCPNTMA